MSVVIEEASHTWLTNATAINHSNKRPCSTAPTPLSAPTALLSPTAAPAFKVLSLISSAISAPSQAERAADRIPNQMAWDTILDAWSGDSTRGSVLLHL
ncbi:hypothetical protein BST61_g3877 [Cercospora zeina]